MALSLYQRRSGAVTVSDMCWPGPYVQVPVIIWAVVMLSLSFPCVQ